MRLVVIWLVLAVTSVAHAHQTSVKYVDLAAGHGAKVLVTVKLGPGDVTEPMGLPADATPPVADAAAHPAVPGFVQSWFDVADCSPPGPANAHPLDERFLSVTYTIDCLRPHDLTLDFARFFALDQRHEAIVRLSAPGKAPVQAIVRAAHPRVVMVAGRQASLLAWVITGMDHIFGGIDHVLFVVSLLLVVMLQREPASGTWQIRSLVPMLRSTALVITAFTVAHSITLIAAALGVIALPSHIVEALIAVSIVYTAAEDVAKPDVRWRFALTFAFGLIHGLGFASVLAELLPPSDIVLPLLLFNLGVELGQLLIVVLVLPLLWILARKIGASRYRRIALPILATPIFLVGVSMVIDRVT